MKVSEIEEGKLYSDGKSARVATFLHPPYVDYATSVDTFTHVQTCTLKRFARWAKYPCTFELQVSE